MREFGTTLTGGGSRGQTWRPIDRRAMGQDRTAAPASPPYRPGWCPLGWGAGGHRRHPLGAEDRGAVARSASRVPESRDVMAALAPLVRRRHVGTHLARAPDAAARG